LCSSNLTAAHRLPPKSRKCHVGVFSRTPERRASRWGRTARPRPCSIA